MYVARYWKFGDDGRLCL